MRARFADSFPKAGSRGSGVVVVVELSKHCVERWRDRFRAGLDFNSARRELEGVLACAGGEPVDLAPEWSRLAAPDSHTSFLALGDDLVLVLIERGGRLLAKTCVSRGTISPGERQRRESRRRSRRRREGGRSREGRRAEPYRRDLRSELRLVVDEPWRTG